MKISVIIPVFNAEKYIARAGESALQQNEVDEVIFIDDGSSDNSINICNSFHENNNKVKVIKHPDGLNHGAGASRNLGIKEAKCEYIAFLDADDFYCENRFLQTSQIFMKNPDIDGVYEVLGVSYNSERSKNQHIDRMKQIKQLYHNPTIPLEYTGMEPNIPPKELFKEMIVGKKGWVHLNTLTLKKASIDNFQLFSSLNLGEDSEFIFRLAHEKILLSSNNVRPVAVRNVHRNNRIPYSGYHQLLWEYMFNYFLKRRFDKTISRVIVRNYLNNYSKNYYNCSNSILREAWKLWNFFTLSIKYPRMIHYLLS
ncbi:MAG: hypothetical protein CMG71_01290 [Candidatus Marinimicrobia bacterium]|nr:hypothetical protein [Candidatus Neomarinimicrobiota bacterium]|tara:strand:- start:565 stop:1500 length:936 start_codon:yes stop_codon:yes gene_type:complete